MQVSVTSIKYDIGSVALCIMPNHFHHGAIAWKRESISGFVQEFESKFAIGYNVRHQAHGRLFTKSAGYASKRTAKTTRSCLLYIADNPVVGKIKTDSLTYRWNFIAYKDNKYPFSKPIVKRNASYTLRKACDTVDWWRSHNLYLSYNILDQLFFGLTSGEAESLTDYIISAYMIIDFSFTERVFENWTSFLAMLSVSAGSEYDIPEDWDDYSVYNKMSVIIHEEGIDMSKVNFEKMDISQLNRLFRKITGCGPFSNKQIKRFFHIHDTKRDG